MEKKELKMAGLFKFVPHQNKKPGDFLLRPALNEILKQIRTYLAAPAGLGWHSAHLTGPLPPVLWQLTQFS